jgi:hypothetical protein
MDKAKSIKALFCIAEELFKSQKNFFLNFCEGMLSDFQSLLAISRNMFRLGWKMF